VIAHPYIVLLIAVVLALVVNTVHLALRRYITFSKLASMTWLCFSLTWTAVALFGYLDHYVLQLSISGLALANALLHYWQHRYRNRLCRCV